MLALDLTAVIERLDTLRLKLNAAGGPRVKRAARRLDAAIGLLRAAGIILADIAPGDVELPPLVPVPAVEVKRAPAPKPPPDPAPAPEVKRAPAPKPTSDPA